MNFNAIEISRHFCTSLSTTEIISRSYGSLLHQTTVLGRSFRTKQIGAEPSWSQHIRNRISVQNSRTPPNERGCSCIMVHNIMFSIMTCKYGMPDRIRTCDLVSRSHTRYPTAPRAHIQFSARDGRGAIFKFGSQVVVNGGRIRALRRPRTQQPYGFDASSPLCSSETSELSGTVARCPVCAVFTARRAASKTF